MKTFFLRKSLYFFLFLLITGMISCTKEGPGGKSSVAGSVKHHDALIPEAIVYIKYGATEFPGKDVSKYDASTIADANAFYEFKNLRKGDYYLYSVGWDVTMPGEVTGGVGVKIKYNQQKYTDIPVTE
jgi:hypothetical protein